MLRFTFDRAAREAMRLPDGQPVSGRLRAILYVDADDDRSSGLAAGAEDLRTGADWRLEVGVIVVGEDLEERRRAAALLTATLASLDPGGRQRVVWRAGDDTDPRSLAARGEWVEVRLPSSAKVDPGARLVLIDQAGAAPHSSAVEERAWDGRLRR